MSRVIAKIAQPIAVAAVQIQLVASNSHKLPFSMRPNMSIGLATN